MTEGGWCREYRRQPDCYRTILLNTPGLGESISNAILYLEGIILKPSMVISGTECPQRSGVKQVAEATLRYLQQTVPAAVPGVAFLSGGQGDEQATQHLNAMNQMAAQRSLPWRLTFSYARALQNQVLETWRGDASKAEQASEALLQRAKLNALASLGKYASEMEHAAQRGAR